MQTLSSAASRKEIKANRQGSICFRHETIKHAASALLRSGGVILLDVHLHAMSSAVHESVTLQLHLFAQCQSLKGSYLKSWDTRQPFATACRVTFAQR